MTATSNTLTGDTVEIPVMNGTTDCISRQAAIDAIETTSFDDYGDYVRIRELIEELPTVQPEITADYIIEWPHKQGFVIECALYAEMKRKCAGCVYEPIERVW